ncbi:MAG: IS21 family transposase [Bacteroidales bacterium]|nr:IS21 family transposase [Bacteroidales bacterium]
MKRYLNMLIMYHEIQKMERQGHSISYIADYLGINWRTVKKYLSMDDREYEAYLSSQANRSRELAPYEHFVKTKLDLFPDTSASQMHDWLKEYDNNFPAVNPKTVYNFVMWVRQEYNIPKQKKEREYFIVEELPFGKQAQVDFGEYNMRTSTGGRKKVYFFSMVLSRSRYKYVYFSDIPFTSSLAIKAHEKAFRHFDGIPEEIVYDQDTLFINDENFGDIILTKTFKQYINQRRFSTYFCRKSDPESKGKVENVVKYVKQNFLYNRSYFDLKTLNDEVYAWLSRTANNMPHGKTKLPPVDQWNIEREHLTGFIPIKFQFDGPDLYKVRKDNVVNYKSNFYTLPQGTYTGNECKVKLIVSNNFVIIQNLSGKELCRHKLCTGKGETIKNNDHKRDKSQKINQMIIDIAKKFDSPSKATRYFELLRAAKPRYIRDQLLLVKKCFEDYSAEAVNTALEFCQEKQVYSASDFKSVTKKIQQDLKQKSKPNITHEIKTLPEGMVNIDKLKPNTSQIIDYESLMSNTN